MVVRSGFRSCRTALFTAVNRFDRAALCCDASDDANDGWLLSRFVQVRDESAFGDLVRRLGQIQVRGRSGRTI